MSIAKKVTKVVGFTAVVLSVATVATFAGNSEKIEAASAGVYTATATPSYRNPSTGAVEDSGGESQYTLGQSMTESATTGEALVEVDGSGTYTTIRLGLSNYVSNVSFSINGSSVSSTVMQSNSSNNTVDYRFKIPSENSIIKCSMYVEPMHRNVVYFITLSNLKSGSGNFITSIKTVTESEEKSSSSSKKEQTKPSSSSESSNTQSSNESNNIESQNVDVSSDNTSNDVGNTTVSDETSIVTDTTEVAKESESKETVNNENKAQENIKKDELTLAAEKCWKLIESTLKALGLML